MSEGFNKVLLLGNLAADPELKVTQGGQSVLKLRLACNERYQDKSGVWQDKTEFVSVTVWGKRGESLHKILAKGSQVFVEGSLHTSSYEKDGNKVWKTEVNAKSVLLGGRAPASDNDAPPRRPARTSNPSRPAPSNDDESPEDDSGEIPF